MATLVSLQQKYTSLPPSASWPSILGTRFFGANMADLDNDGRDEIIAFSPGLQTATSGPLASFSSPQVNAFGVMSYFSYEEMNSNWSAASAQTGLISAATVQSNQQNWASAPAATDQVWKGSIRDTNGIDLLIFDGDQTISLIRWENTPFSVNDQTAQVMALNNYWSASGTITGSAGSWGLSANDQFAVGDVDGDGIIEILVFDGNNTLGLLKWIAAQNALQLIWQSTGGNIPGVSPAWNIFPANTFKLGDIDGDGKDEIIAFDGSSWLGVIKWIDSAFSAIWLVSSAVPAAPGSTAGEWSIGSNDWFHLADINGDGLQEVVMVSYTAMGALAWSDSALQTLGVSTSTVSGPGGNWAINIGQTNYLADFKQNGQASIFAVSSVQQSSFPLYYASVVAVISWSATNAGFEVDYMTTPDANELGVSVAGTGPTGFAWIFTSDNRFTCADVDGDGIAEIIVQTDAAQTLGLLKWDSSQSELVTLWSYSDAGPSQVPLPAWGMTLINNAPVSKFIDFTGDQLTVYQNASSSLLPKCKDIRSEYTGVNETPNLFGWGQDLLNADPSVPNWSWMNDKDISQADIQTVFGQLETELLGGGQLYNLISSKGGMSDLITDLSGQRQEDLQIVVNNLIGLGR